MRTKEEIMTDLEKEIYEMIGSADDWEALVEIIDEMKLEPDVLSEDEVKKILIRKFKERVGE